MMRRSDLDPYVSTGRVGVITLWVVIVHVALFFLLPLALWLVSLIEEEKEPPLTVMKVGLVDLPEGDSLDAPKDGIKLPPPAPEPAPEPEPVPSPEPEPEEKTVKPPPPAPPKLKAEIRTPPPPPKQKPDKPKNKPKPKYLTAEEIRQKRNKNPKRIVEQVQPAPSAADRQRQQAAQQRRDAIRNVSNNIGKYGHVDGGGVADRLATMEEKVYMEKLFEYIDPLFVQPSASLLRNQTPTVEVYITVDTNGALLGWEIHKASNVPAMNEAVEALHAKLKHRIMPKPPRKMKIPILLKIRKRPR